MSMVQVWSKCNFSKTWATRQQTTHNSKLYVTGNRVMALFRWQENTATAVSTEDLQRLPQRRWGRGGGRWLTHWPVGVGRMRFTTQWWAAFGVKSFKAAVISSLTTDWCSLYSVRVTHLESLLAAEANWLFGPGTGQNLYFLRNFKQE